MLEQGCLSRPHASVFSLAAFLNAQPVLYQAANRCWQRARPDPSREGPAAFGPTVQYTHEETHRAAFGDSHTGTAQRIEQNTDNANSKDTSYRTRTHLQLRWQMANEPLSEIHQETR